MPQRARALRVAPIFGPRYAETIYVSKAPLPSGTRSDGAPIRAGQQTGDTAEFYIGWQSKSPKGLGRRTRNVSAAVCVTIPALFILSAWFQNPVDPGTFEFGVERTFEGTLFESPLPVLQIHETAARSGMNFLLVGSRKFGPPEALRGKDGYLVRFKGQPHL
jgi:hypothetical protein